MLTVAVDLLSLRAVVTSRRRSSCGKHPYYLVAAVMNHVGWEPANSGGGGGGGGGGIASVAILRCSHRIVDSRFASHPAPIDIDRPHAVLLHVLGNRASERFASYDDRFPSRLQRSPPAVPGR